MAGARVFTHVSDNRALEYVYESVSADKTVLRTGKPGGFWLAPDLTWIDLIAKRKSWEIAGAIVEEAEPAYRFDFTKEFYDDVFRGTPAEDYTEGTPLQPISVTQAGQSGIHFVYQFSVEASKFRPTLDTPSLDATLTLTAEGLPAFLAKIESVHADARAHPDRYAGRLYDRFRDATDPTARRGLFFQSFLADHWGGIFFDTSLFTDELKKEHAWIFNLELPTLCLWHPTRILGLIPGTVTLPSSTEPIGRFRPDDLKAVLMLTGTPERLARLVQKGNEYARVPLPPLKPYLSKLWVAGAATDTPRLVMLMRKGELVPGAQSTFGAALKGGSRGRTFRRKPRRRNKNGSRLARQSLRRRNQ